MLFSIIRHQQQKPRNIIKIFTEIFSCNTEDIMRGDAKKFSDRLRNSSKIKSDVWLFGKILGNGSVQRLFSNKSKQIQFLLKERISLTSASFSTPFICP